MTTPIDAHLHVFDPLRLSYPWLADEPDIDRLFVPSDIGTALAPRFVIVQAGTVPEHGLAEARWVDALAADGAPIDGIVAFTALERGRAVSDELDALAEVPRVRGVRRLLQDEPLDFFEAESLREGLSEVARRGWTFDACIRWWQLPALADLLADVPELPVVLDHLGKPPVTDDPGSPDGARWREGIERLSRLPRVHVKLSGLPAEASDPALPPSSLGPWLRAAVSAFGAERSMVGSDWPVSRDRALRLGYDDWFALVRGELGLSDAESARVLAGTATAFYRLGQRRHPWESVPRRDLRGHHDAEPTPGRPTP